MSVDFPHPRGPRGRAARLAGGVALALAVVAAASVLLGAWLGLRGRGADRARGGSGDPVTVGTNEPTAVEAGHAEKGAEAVGEAGGRPEVSPAGAAGPELARDREGDGEADEDADADADAGGGGRRPGPGAEQVLAFLDEFERQVDAAMARARESIVALEYTAGRGSSGRRRIASGVVINARGEILSVRIDPPRVDPASGPPAAGKPGRDPEPTPIVARDYLGRRHAARWVAADPHTGLTLLRVSPRAVRPIRPASDGPKLGSQVFVLGNPFGMGHSVNRGHVAGLDRVLELGSRQLGGLIQVQAPLYPGDSGAAVVDVRGGWLGLIRGGLAIPGTGRPSPAPATEAGASPPSTSTRAPDPRDEVADLGDAESDTDFGFAIPTRDALWIAEQLRVHGRVDRAYLGVRLETMPVSEGPTASVEPATAPAPAETDTNPPSATAPAPGPSGAWRGSAGPVDAMPPTPSEPDPAPVPGDGARICEVVDGTPAARAGLRPGDRIVTLDGQAIRSRNDLIDRLDRIPARKTIVLGVIREGDPARPRFEVKLRTASRSVPPGPGSVEGPAAPRSTGASVPVTPTASRVEPPVLAPAPVPAPAPPPPAAVPAPAPSSGVADPAPPASGEARPGSGSVTGGKPDRPEAASPAAGPPRSFNELKLTLPRAVVERIEHLERRIDELEHLRAAARTGTENRPGGADSGRDPRPQPAAASSRVGEHPGRSPGPR